jgi:hypothetical protein
MPAMFVAAPEISKALAPGEVVQILMAGVEAEAALEEAGGGGRQR